MFCMWGIINPDNPGDFWTCPALSHSLRGVALARCKLNAAKPSLLLDIDPQFQGSGMMDPRQDRHTWVSVIIDFASASPSQGTCRTISKRTSAGSLFTGCNPFWSESENLCRSRILILRVSIW